MSAHTIAYRSSHPHGWCEGTFAVQQTGQNRTIHLGPEPLRPANDHHLIIPVSQTKCYSPYINHPATTQAREHWASHVCWQRTNLRLFLIGGRERGLRSNPLAVDTKKGTGLLSGSIHTKWEQIKKWLGLHVLWFSISSMTSICSWDIYIEA